MRALIMLLVAAVLLFPRAATAAIINIPGDYPTIQEGIDHGQQGDTVLVQPGTYYENINFNGHNIVVASMYLTTGDTAYISSTIIDGHSCGSVITFESGEDNNAVITGFTIRKGMAEDGGGVYCWYSSPVISDNIIRNNRGNRCGGGVCCWYCGAIITRNRIIRNSALEGAGINCPHHYSGVISHNIIHHNSADATGGGIICNQYCTPTVSHNSICYNTAGQYAGGLHFDDWSLGCIVNNTFFHNSAGIAGGGIWCENSSHPSITNTILWGDTPDEIYLTFSSHPTVTYCDVQGGWQGQGNIDADPLFVDPEGGDFHLQYASPCIDTGDPDSPPDPDGTRTDMGALHFPQVRFRPEQLILNLDRDSSVVRPLTIWNPNAYYGLDFSLVASVNWISFIPDSAYVFPDSLMEVTVTFVDSGLPLGPNNATIELRVLAPYQAQREIPVCAHVFSAEYTFISLTPDSLPIVIPPEGGSFSYWAHTYNATDFTYRFDVWIDATLPGGRTYGPIYKKRNFVFRRQQSTGYHLTQYVPGYAPPGGYSYNCKMGVFPDQVDFQDSFTFIKFDTGLLAGSSPVTGWDLVGWQEELIASLRQEQKQAALIPTQYSLSQNYPNPFNASTIIEYELPKPCWVRLEVFNIRGQRVDVQTDGWERPGSKAVRWDRQAASGIYFYRLTAGDFIDTKRMLLVK
jgi:hypothetical protein